MKTGKKIRIDNLALSEKGTVPVVGKVVWITKSPDQRHWTIGVSCDLSGFRRAGSGPLLNDGSN